jgi:hypothetical protein
VLSNSLTRTSLHDKILNFKKKEISMDARLQKIQITPVKLNAEGDIQKPETAVINLEVPIDSISQREAIIELMEVLGKEWVKVEITAPQIPIREKQSLIEALV